jgi:hypothetical protein
MTRICGAQFAKEMAEKKNVPSAYNGDWRWKTKKD